MYCSPFGLAHTQNPKPIITQVIKLNNCIWIFFKGVIQAGTLLKNQFPRCYQVLPSPVMGREQPSKVPLPENGLSLWPLGGARWLQKRTIWTWSQLATYQNGIFLGSYAATWERLGGSILREASESFTVGTLQMREGRRPSIWGAVEEGGKARSALGTVHTGQSGMALAGNVAGIAIHTPWLSPPLAWLVTVPKALWTKKCCWQRSCSLPRVSGRIPQISGYEEL